MNPVIRRRLIALVPTLVAITMLAFSLQLLIPGGPAEVLAAQSGGTQSVQDFERQLGYDRPWLVRYGEWLVNAAQGDLGFSYRTGTPVRELILDRAGASFALVLLATLTATIVGSVLGIVAAIQRNNRFGRTLTALFGLGLSIPNFWLATLMVGFFAVTLGWLPAGGYPGFDNGLVEFGRSMIMPVIVLALPSSALIARQVNSAMVKALESSYVRTARATGLTKRDVVWVHALRNSLSPLVVLLPVVVSSLVGGAVVVESIFNIPGLGSAIVDAALQRDFLVLQGIVLILALLVLILNILADIALGIIDPRVRSASA
ncbi:ABC transporter permease [Aeromicrobium fastidiosum]|uniref:ABC transporter permease n=1 Tax=Aeromicrobium fastidiosum TaxID=52699 RepID=A0A641AP88_9ACTN|nr:ABC transporter permease [Aeromicrobium fastidiosum]KAA1379906.1 ABC transporter permease [Aeromicrobium fastidiosum]MBP2389412.1 peptide/nickel transport system permease protein [Aeromicrobium fastidiosum]